MYSNFISTLKNTKNTENTKLNTETTSSYPVVNLINNYHYNLYRHGSLNDLNTYPNGIRCPRSLPSSFGQPGSKLLSLLTLLQCFLVFIIFC